MNKTKYTSNGELSMGRNGNKKCYIMTALCLQSILTI